MTEPRERTGHMSGFRLGDALCVHGSGARPVPLEGDDGATMPLVALVLAAHRIDTSKPTSDGDAGHESEVEELVFMLDAEDAAMMLAWLGAAFRAAKMHHELEAAMRDATRHVSGLIRRHGVNALGLMSSPDDAEPGEPGEPAAAAITLGGYL